MSGRFVKRHRRKHLGQHLLDESGSTFAQHLVRQRQAIRPALRRFGRRTRIRQDQRRNLLTRSPPELEQRVSADGDADKEGLRDSLFPAKRGQIGCQFLHRGRPVAQLRVAMRPQIGHDQPVSRAQLFSNRLPEGMVQRKRVQQNNIWTIAGDFIEELGIGAAECRHRVASRRKKAPTFFLASLRNDYEPW